VKSRRDAGFTALFLGFFAAAWFGWAQADSTLGTWLLVGSIASLVVAVLGAVVGFRRPSVESALHDRARYRRYGIIVGIEFALAGVGAAILGISGAAAYIPIWVCAVVGVHFFPLAPVLEDPRTPPARGGNDRGQPRRARQHADQGNCRQHDHWYRRRPAPALLRGHRARPRGAALARPPGISRRK
jgi:hypothetical protein